MFDKVNLSVRYNFFNREKEIPQNLLIELRTLLLSNINIDAVLKKINDTNILYYNDFGKYLLVKIDDIPSQIKQQDRVKETIKKAFTMSNMDIETFLNESKTWQVNKDKWQAADKYAKARGWQFIILTEYELFNDKYVKGRPAERTRK